MARDFLTERVVNSGQESTGEGCPSGFLGAGEDKRRGAWAGTRGRPNDIDRRGVRQGDSEKMGDL